MYLYADLSKSSLSSVYVNEDSLAKNKGMHVTTVVTVGCYLKVQKRLTIHLSV